MRNIVISIFISIYLGWTLGLYVHCGFSETLLPARQYTLIIPILLPVIFSYEILKCVKEKNSEKFFSFLKIPCKSIILMFTLSEMKEKKTFNKIVEKIEEIVTEYNEKSD